MREIGDELYALAPQAFTAARDEWIAQARQQGEPAVAGELGALKRPTVAAWLVNLLALRRPDVVTDLLDLGEAIRAAQGSVPPAQLRDLSAQRRRALDAALTVAGSLATAAGEPAPGRQPLAEVEATLAAAMADESAARLVCAGRVLKPLHYSGFGAGLGAAAPARTPAKAAPAAPAAEEEQQRQRAVAEARVADANSALDAAMRAELVARERVDELTEELAAVNERLEAAQRDARDARQERVTAQRALESAQRRLHPPRSR